MCCIVEFCTSPRARQAGFSGARFVNSLPTGTERQAGSPHVCARHLSASSSWQSVFKVTPVIQVAFHFDDLKSKGDSEGPGPRTEVALITAVTCSGAISGSLLGGLVDGRPPSVS